MTVTDCKKAGRKDTDRHCARRQRVSIVGRRGRCEPTVGGFTDEVNRSVDDGSWRKIDRVATIVAESHSVAIQVSQLRYRT